MLCWLQDSALACSIVIAYLTNLLRKVLKATTVRDEASIRLSMLCCAVVFLDFVGVAYDTALDRGLGMLCALRLAWFVAQVDVLITFVTFATL